MTACVASTVFLPCLVRIADGLRRLWRGEPSGCVGIRGCERKTIIILGNHVGGRGSAEPPATGGFAYGG